MAPDAGPTALDDLVASPFTRLAALLHGIEPGMPPIDMSLGEPRALIPAFLGPGIERHLAEFGRYPPIRGIPAAASGHRRLARAALSAHSRDM